MDLLCSQETANSTDLEWQYSCQAHATNTLAALGTTYMSMLLLICLRYSGSGDHGLDKQPADKPPWLPHWVRPLLAIGLLLSLLGELAESMIVLSSPQVPTAPRTLLPLAAATSSVCLWLLSEVLQTYLSPRPLLSHSLSRCLDPLVAACNVGLACARTFSVIAMTWWGAARIDHVRPIFESVSAILYLLIAVVHLSHLLQRRKSSGWQDRSENDLVYESYQYDSSNLYSKITFSWMLPLLHIGNNSPLELEDLGHIPTAESTQNHFKKFADTYNYVKGKRKNNVSLWLCYILHSWQMFTLSGALKLTGDLVGFVGPLGISAIVRYAERSTIIKIDDLPNHSDIKLYATIEEFFSNGYIMGFILFIATLAQGTLSQNSTHIINVEGIRIKAALQAMIYDKSLRMPLWTLAEPTDQDEKNKTPFPSANSTSPKSHPDNTRCGTANILSQNVSNQDGGALSSPVDTGSITNFMSEDTFNVMSFIWISHYVWAIPVKVGVIMFLLHHKLGMSALIGGILCVVIMTPLQFIIGKKMSLNSKQISDAGDERLRRINEVLHGIKLIKLSGWEELYETRVQAARSRELMLLNHDSLHWALMTFLTHASSTLVTLVTFGVYLLLENSPLPTADVFSGLALFNQLTVPLFIFPITVPIIINAMVSTKRLEDFLAQADISVSSGCLNFLMDKDELSLYKTKEVEEDERYWHKKEDAMHEEDADDVCELNVLSGVESTHIPGCFPKDGFASTTIIPNNIITIEHASYSWQHGGSITLSNVYIPRGKMTLIVGAIGSGKSSFLLALLGEMTQLGDCSGTGWNRSATIAYCSQKPWLLNTSLRENILFGETYQRRLYSRVIAACALQPDLDILPLRDMTEIGERGISLSGGQKHRVTIARALYSQADIVFMDDPLSALDYLVGQHLVREGFKKLITQKGRTFILATHCLQLLPEADHIIVMDHGVVNAQGSLNDIRTKRPDLAQAWQQALIVTQDDSSDASSLLGVRGEKTARERWQLVRLVSRFGLQQQSQVEDQPLKPGPHYKLLNRKHSRSLYGGHTYSSNFPLPVDECTIRMDGCARRKVSFKTEELWEKPLRRTKSTVASSSDIWHKNSVRFHRKVTRVSSLQPRDFGRAILRGSPAYAWSYPVNIEPHKSAAREKVKPPVSKDHVKVHPIHSASQSESLNQKSLPHDGIKNKISGTFEVQDVEQKCGKISRLVYFIYLKSCSGSACMAYVISTFMWQALRVCTDFWLSNWTGYGGHNKNGTMENQSLFQQEMLKYLFVYSVLSVGTILLSLTSNLVGQLAGARARHALHRQLLSKLLHCPIKFFDTTPIGRLIDCFSVDIAIIDKKLASSIQRLMQFLSLCCSAILVNTIIFPWFLLPALPMCVAYYAVQHFYRVSSRELHRMDNITRTPILSFFTETLGGLSTIRAYDQQSRFMNEMLSKMDIHNNISLMLCAANRWLGIALDYLGGAIVLVSIIGALLASYFHSNVVTPSLVGLAVNYTLLVPIYLNWVVKFLADVEMYMSSVERIHHYGKMPEEDYTKQGLQVLPLWPEKGDIVFKDVTLQYDTREPVITKLNLRIPAGQKVGLCGRTGSGKSSLVMSLFRMLDLTEGSILMDGVDISQLPLHLLRSRLSIIPQDVVMFSGTIRLNLDPYGIYSEDEIWKSLDLAQLKNVVQKLPGCLDACVKEGGENFSVGTRQLFCLARAILHNAAILIMDEATSSVDPTTEQALLSAALQAFAHRTVIIVAHRLSTIADCDRILVLDSGNIIEDGHPSKLLRCEKGIFTLMLSATCQTKK